MKGRVNRPWTKLTRQTRTRIMMQVYIIDLSALKPTVAFPHLPENTKTIDEVGDVTIRSGCHRLLHQRTAAAI